MAYVCDNCGKSTVYGRSSSHGRGVAGRRWKKRAQKTSRTFKPNLQKIAVTLNGVKLQMKLCHGCIKRYIKDGKIKKSQSLASAALG